MRTDRLYHLPLLLLCTLPSAIAVPEQHVLQALDPLPLEHGQKPLDDERDVSGTRGTLPAFLDALDVLQAEYFQDWQGLWPDGIDWTSAVIGTYVSASLNTISTSFSSLSSSPKFNENLINRYFSQLVAYYFGQDAFALRQEAYDDILWVVLGWLESIKFINKHSEMHYTNGYWYGRQWIPAFAHRARVFWDLASQGWNTSLCGGGMIWSPWLVPYKNAITNELFISASISMYLYFPGDDNASPFMSYQSLSDNKTTADWPGGPKDPKYLAAAIEAYKWLNTSNMTDSSGLYVDGYHISGWARNNSNNTRCDERNEMVYTYNQGVLLSGQRGLYEATGAKSYLHDGHALTQSTIAATGWDLESQAPHSDNTLGKWNGLGRVGIMEDTCDASGTCSQDGQTFKGIFFHHLTLFCARLPDHLVLPDDQAAIHTRGALAEIKKWHDAQCATYGPWIQHNANAALATRNREGKFGMWWGEKEHAPDDDTVIETPAGAVDYRNLDMPEPWKKNTGVKTYEHEQHTRKDSGVDINKDRNDRNRGRTVETQGGGIAVLRAMWEVVDSRHA
ncbi:hypothetical protein LSUB1_G004579 [Lachnellula subtilissima]|uniref:Glycosyl hydrolase n=1 Tax=Lachnellula subtilissima TaxID=602034 RepID=A0A8H8RQY8_9HELO|nr:hypothetical protein LSUB1_G004579 [Lachnellula subtilissima]